MFFFILQFQNVNANVQLQNPDCTQNQNLPLKSVQTKYFNYSWTKKKDKVKQSATPVLNKW